MILEGLTVEAAWESRGNGEGHCAVRPTRRLRVPAKSGASDGLCTSQPTAPVNKAETQTAPYRGPVTAYPWLAGFRSPPACGII